LREARRSRRRPCSHGPSLGLGWPARTRLRTPNQKTQRASLWVGGAVR
jgi:hypothetical protein